MVSAFTVLFFCASPEKYTNGRVMFFSSMCLHWCNTYIWNTFNCLGNIYRSNSNFQVIYKKKKNHSILERDSSMWCLEELTSHGVTESSKILSHSKEKHLENWKNTFFLILRDLWCAVKREKSKVHWKGENLMTEC